MKKLKLDELGRMPVDTFKETKKIPLIIILENIRSALNIGSVFRTADAFPVERIILSGITAKPPHKDILKTALGATESVQWQYVEHTNNIIPQLQNDGYTVYAVEQTDGSIFLNHFHPEATNKIVLVFGNEVDGVKNETLHLCNGSLELQQYGTKHSLNVAVCAGIVIYDLFHKMQV